MEQLFPTGFPVPKPIHLCEDESIISFKFSLVEFVEGRYFPDFKLLELSKDEKRELFYEAINTLARLHSLKIDASFIDTSEFMLKDLDN